MACDAMPQVREGVERRDDLTAEERRVELESMQGLEQRSSTQLAALTAERDALKEELATRGAELEELRSSSRREMAALWLAVNKQDVLDSAKNAALDELRADRERAILSEVIDL